MNWFIRLLSLALVLQRSLQIPTPEETSYIAAVVEFNPKSSAHGSEEIFNNHTKQYVDYIDSNSNNNFDIIVFPESTLNDRSTAVNYPNAKTQPVPCDNEEFNENLQQISCAAKRSKRYVVINLTTKTNCSLEKAETNDTRECAPSGWNLYNTNLVFDRNGAIISTYRKFNLFGELGINTTLFAEKSSFKTDFNVTFGHFVCFDLLFKSPALELLKQGIDNVILPTMWFSELPFLTAVQIQQNWAHTFNVNLLAAGSSVPSIGSTGSGIYSGKQGALDSRMNSEAETDLLIATVSKVPGDLLPQSQSQSIKVEEESTTVPPSDVSQLVLPLKLKRDPNLNKFKFVSINISSSAEQQNEICYGDLCCDFNIKIGHIKYNDEPVNQTFAYSYVAAVYNGIRTYDGVTQESYISVCAVFACTNSSNIDTCGTQYPVGTHVLNRFKFEKISIKGRFNTTHIYPMPNSVNTAIMPLNPNEFNYTESSPFEIDKTLYKNIALSLVNPKEDLLTFGIYGSDFTVTVPGSAERTYISFLLLLASAIYNLL